MAHLEHVRAKRRRCHTVVDEAICFLTTGHMKLQEVLEHFHGLGSNRDFWIAYVNAKGSLPMNLDEDMPELVVSHCSPQLLQDKELVVQYLSKLDRSSRDETVFDCLSEFLKRDEDVVRAFLAHSPYFCLTKYSTYVKAYPDLVANTLQQLPLAQKQFCDILSRSYADLLKFNRNVVIAWAKAGGYAKSDFMWADDEEVLLEFLKQDSCELFEFSIRLRNDKAFMLKAIKSNPRFLIYSSCQ
jgi:hypothetical protein